MVEQLKELGAQIDGGARQVIQLTLRWAILPMFVWMLAIQRQVDALPPDPFEAKVDAIKAGQVEILVHLAEIKTTLTLHREGHE